MGSKEMICPTRRRQAAIPVNASRRHDQPASIHYDGECRPRVTRVKRTTCAIIVAWLLAVPARADDPDELLGKWELSEAALGMPAGAIWDFRKGGDLLVAVKDKSLAFKYERKGTALILEIKGQKDITEIMSLTKTTLFLKDNDGVAFKFKKGP